jgi:hypothetical protein
MPKGRQPIVLPALEKAYVKDWKNSIKKTFENLTMDEATAKLVKDSGVQIKAGALYGFMNREVEGFSFKTTGKRGKQPVFQPALEKKFGNKWEAEFKEICKDKTLEDATVSVNEAIGLTVGTATVLSHAKALGIEFIPSEKGETKARGKKSTILPLLLKHYKTEDALKKALASYSGQRIADIAAAINREANVNIAAPNYYNLLKKYEVSLSCTRKRKSANTGIPVDSDVPEGVELPKVASNEVPVKFTCQTPKCTGERGNRVDLEFGLGLRARRCPECNEFGTLKAQYRKPDGTIASVVLKDVNGITCEIDESEILQEVGSE